MPDTRETNRRDWIKKNVAANLTSVVMIARQSTTTVSNYSGSWELPDGTTIRLEPLPVGHAIKSKSKQVVLTASQRQYLEWAFTMGERDKELKLSSRTAAHHMTIHGTHRGAQMYSESRFSEETRTYWSCQIPVPIRTFRVMHCLDHWYVKSWFSRRKSGKVPPMSVTVVSGDRGDDITSGDLYTIDGVHVSNMLVSPLRKALTERGLSSVGRRVELRERLLKVCV